MIQRSYKVSDFKKVIKESVIEKSMKDFEPVKGKNVDNDNKKNNEKAYKDMEKATSNYDGGFTKEKHFKLPQDDNRGMESLRIENPNKPYSDRVKAQLKGFTSKQAEDIHKNEKLGNAEYGSDETVEQFKKKGEQASQARKRATEIGLTGRELNKQEIDSQYNSLFKESRKIKKLTFRNTVFLSENHMKTRIPESYMIEGNKFIMRDKNANEYLVEWHDNEPIVEKRFTDENLIAEQNRMKHLFNYKSGDKYGQISTASSRLHENNEISDMLGRVRSLMK